MEVASIKTLQQSPLLQCNIWVKVPGHSVPRAAFLDVLLRSFSFFFSLWQLTSRRNSWWPAVWVIVASLSTAPAPPQDLLRNWCGHSLAATSVMLVFTLVSWSSVKMFWCNSEGFHMYSKHKGKEKKDHNRFKWDIRTTRYLRPSISSHLFSSLNVCEKSQTKNKIHSESFLLPIWSSYCRYWQETGFCRPF